MLRIWPPFEAYLTNKEIDQQNQKIGDEKTRFNTIIKGFSETSFLEAPLDDLEKNALRIQEYEIKRNETIENKAASLIGSMGIAMTIISIVPALFGSEWNIPRYYAICAGIAYLLSVIHLLAGIYYAIKVRKVVGYERPCVDRFQELLKEKKWSKTDRVILAQTKWNEPILTKKVNLLIVAESVFLRGLALIAFAAIVSIFAKLT
jgi:hypothetical protein